MSRTLGLLLVLFCLAGPVLVAQEQKKDEPELTKEEREKLEAEAKRLGQEGGQHYRAAKLVEAEKAWHQALQMRRQLYPARTFPDGHPDLAISLSNLALVFQAQGQLTQAEPLYRDALAMRQKLYPPTRFPDGHPELGRSLNNLGFLLHAQGKLAQAEPLFRDALAMHQKRYPPARFPDGHPELAGSLNNLAFILQAQGKFTQAEPLYREAMAMHQKLYPPARYPDGHPHLATSLNNLGFLLQAQGKLTQAEPLCRDALAMRHKLFPPARFPDGHPNLANSLSNLALVLKAQGKFTQAEPLCRDALAMRHKLHPPARFPDGHPDLALSLNNLGLLLQAQGKFTQAEPLCRDALAMRHKLFPPARFPDGHPDLALSLNNLGLLLQAQGKFTQAEPLCRDALAMWRKLYPPARYPEGHPGLALSLNNLATVLQVQGKFTQAEPLYRDALAMRHKLYPTVRFPDGHPDLAGSLNNLAAALRAQDKLAQAEPLYREALAMYRRLAVAHAEVRGEGEVLMVIETQPATQGAYLSLLQRQTELAPQGYTTLWDDRSYLGRLAAQKRLAMRATAVSPALRQRWEELVSLKQQRAQLLMAPESRDRETNKAREKLLEEWGRKINDLSAQVREGLPALQELQRLDNSTPADLQKALPQEAVFVDLLRYTFFECDPQKPGKEGEKRSLRYVAFVVTKAQVHHIDLGPAEPLETAVRQWRENITRKQAASQSPATLRRLLWEPLEKHFPLGTKTVFLCPDEMLCFLPWGALPGKKADTVLLEDYSLAIVSHGPYLLGQLLGTKEKEHKTVDLLVLGGVKYDDAPTQPAAITANRGLDDPKAAPVQAVKGGWPYLRGTAQEADALVKLAAKQNLKTQLLAEKDAGIERFKQELPKARIAHLATHGFFADAKFRATFRMDESLFAMQGNERVGVGALNPSVLSGLVFAGANRPETPGRGILTAEELLDLDLTGMELAVLSACETGLGDTAGGEGVFGLQRAFHVAGCRNVVASLWKVNDVATLVLMEEFYRNLWEKKLSKREALRQAQLTVYRKPELVEQRRQELLAELKKAGATREQLALRGIEDDAAPLPAAPPGTVRRSPAAWWAAFVLSGVGD